MSTVNITGGSEKQNSWATDIANTWISKVDAEIDIANRRIADGEKLEWYLSALEAGKSAFINGLPKASAKQIIDLYMAKIDPTATIIKKAMAR